MESIEITVRVNEPKEDVIKKLLSNGFKQTSDEYGDDLYMTKDLSKLTKDNILEILNKAILLRHHYGKYREERSFVVLKDKKYQDGKVTSEEIISVKIDNVNTMKKILEINGFEELILKKQYFNDFTKDDMVFTLEEVEDIGLLIEFENKNDFTGKSSEEIKEEKEKMYNIIKNFNIDIADDYDVKKAYELITKKYFNR